jgi:hypothetical protein
MLHIELTYFQGSEVKYQFFQEYLTYVVFQNLGIILQIYISENVLLSICVDEIAEKFHAI